MKPYSIRIAKTSHTLGYRPDNSNKFQLILEIDGVFDSLSYEILVRFSLFHGFLLKRPIFK
jgi:hypothetical protein